MSKTKISEYSATANSNTDVGGINIDEGCAPSGINDAIRTLMAQLKNFQTGASGDTITVGGVLTVTGGSAAAPALTTSGDTNTGVLFPAADTIALTTGGTERARIDSSGNLGIGTSSPGAKLDVNSGTNSEMRVTTSGSGYLQVGQFTNGAFIGTSSTDATAGLLRFGTGGSVRATIDGSGNLGLGVTPSASTSNYRTLQIGGSTTKYSIFGQRVAGNSESFMGWNAYGGSNTTTKGTGFYYVNTGDAATMYSQNAEHAWYTAASGTAGNAISFTQAMTLDASGNLGIGTTSPSSKLHVAGNLYYTGDLLCVTGGETARFGYEAYGSTGGFNLWTQGAKPLTFGTNSAERARIDSSGNLLVGKTSVGDTTVGVQLLQTSGVSMTLSSSTNAASTNAVYSTGASAYRFYVGMGGTVYATSTTITGISDQRLKENIRDLDEGLATVMALKPRKFDWKEGKGKGIANDRGFIAQEFEQVLPDMVEEWRDPAPEGEDPYKAVNANLIPTLVKAIQEQQAIITQLQADVAALKA